MIGEAPQDLKYSGEKTTTFIGDNVIIRESVTINRGTIAHGKTVIGNNVLLMACVHVAHDCLVGDNTNMANVATLGGHVELGEYVNLGGGVMVHQFGKIGSHAFVGGGYRVVARFEEFKTQELANAAWSFAKLDLQPHTIIPWKLTRVIELFMVGP